jgi:hypothetical protein
VFTKTMPPVREVWVGGEQRVADGRHPMAAKVKRRFDAVLERLLRDSA